MDMEKTNILVEIGKEAINKAFNFLEVILIPPLKEVGLLAQDQIKFWRFKNQIEIINKAQKYIDEKGIKPSKVSLKILVPILENGSLEEEVEMKEKWSCLLAKSVDSNHRNQSILAHIEILKQLSSSEAKVLEMMYDFHPLNSLKIESSKIRDKKIITKLNLSQEDLYIIQSYLMRLGLIQEKFEEKTVAGRMVTNVPKVHTIKSPTELTDLGLIFVKSCRK